MNEPTKRKLGWRILRWALIGLAIIVTLAAMLITEENWRGKHAWEAYKRAAEARGERFDLASIVPPPVPDDQNFFCTSIARRTLLVNPHVPLDYVPPASQVKRLANTNQFAEVKFGDEPLFNLYRGDAKYLPKTGGNWQKGTFENLKQWQRYFRSSAATPGAKTNGFPVSAQPQSPAADILLALSVYDPAVSELREALRRPQARLPLNYENGFEVAGELLPVLSNLKRCAQFFQLRALANLDLGQSAASLEDIKTLMALNDTIRTDPFLISHLVRIAIVAITLQPVYEGVVQHRWTDVQLKELEQTLAKQNFLAEFDFAMKGENVFAIQTFEKQRITRETQQVEEHDGTNRTVTISLQWMPKAYFYQNQLNFARMNEEIILPLIDVTNRLARPDRFRETQANITAQLKHYSYYKGQALLVFPALAASVKKFTLIQAQVDLACVACALERFRLAHGQYPKTLDELVPQFISQLPHDIINGQPLHYRREANNKFVLYSVGWNGTDDGGVTVLRKGGSVDSEKGDWVWKD
jgi:hypothetical protein